MNCAQAQELLSPHLDNELPAAHAAEVATHLLSCPYCGARFDELKHASRAVRAAPLAPLPPGFLQRLEARRRSAPAAAASPWLSSRAIAFAAAAAVVCVVIVAEPWRGDRLARAPGYALPQEPSLKLDAATPPAAAQGAAGADAAQAGAPAVPAAPVSQSPMPLPPAQDAAQAPAAQASPAAPEDHLVHETAAMLDAAARSNDDSDQGLRVATEEDDEPKADPFMGTSLGTKETHEKAERSIQQLAAMRQAIEAASGKKSDVAIEGSVVPVLGQSSQDDGAAIADKPLVDGFWSGDYAAGNSGTRTIEDNASWAALWRTLSTSPLPPIDFGRSRVVAVFLGPRPTGGYAVEFADIQSTARRVVVRYRERAPDPGETPADGATAPYALKVIARSDLPVRFEKVK